MHNMVNFHKKIKQCIEDKGNEIIASSQFIGILDDNRVFDDTDVQPFKMILREIVYRGYAKKLLELNGHTSGVTVLANKFSETTLFKEAPTLYVFQSLAYGLGWISEEPNFRKIKNQFIIAKQQRNTLLKRNFKGVLNILQEDFRWLSSKENDFRDLFFLFASLVGLLGSLIGIVISWFRCIGHAPVLNWIFFESLVFLIILIIVKGPIRLVIHFQHR